MLEVEKPAAFSKVFSPELNSNDIHICHCHCFLNSLSIYLTGMQQIAARWEAEGVAAPPQILADQLTLSRPVGDTLSPPSTTCPTGFLTLAACLFKEHARLTIS